MTKDLLAEQTLQTQESTFICNINAIPADDRPRYNKLVKSIIQAIDGKRELPDGYAFRLSSERITAQQIVEWINLERSCCPFFGFEVHWEKENGPISLFLTGREGVKAFILSEFDLK